MLAGLLGEEATVYYCTDDHASFPGVDPRTIQPIDDYLTRVADIVFVAPPKLVEAKRALNPNSHYSPHGVDAEMFAKASDPAVQPRNRCGICSTLSSDISGISASGSIMTCW